ncbi:Lsr2 family DNA-binding protein [Arthrobacter sp. Soc17.1.1.1]
MSKLRQWAKDNGYTVSSHGRISHTIINAYNDAHT